MEKQEESSQASLSGLPRAAATVLFFAVMAAAGERALAPLLLEVPDERAAGGARATQAAYRNVTSPDAEPEAAQSTQPDPGNIPMDERIFEE